MKLKLTFLFLLCLSLCFGQKQDNNWYFGDSAGINFNSGFPIAILNGRVNSLEISSTISDKNGNLLFYAGAKKISSNTSDLFLTTWNRNNQILLNGDTIQGFYSSTQGCLIIPFPKDSLHHYLFSLGYYPGFVNRLFYSVINMSLDGGLGGVVQKNVMLSSDTLSEKMQAIKHGNGRDWWLMVHSTTNNTFYEYFIDSVGIHGPNIFNIGSIYGNPKWVGQMIFSPSGNKLFFADMSGYMDLFDFDRCTGIISNYVELGTAPYNLNEGPGFYGCSFSPNDKVLYVSNGDTLFQFDLTAGNIKTSKLVIWIYPHIQVELGQHKLAIDGKIYIASSPVPFPNSIYDSTNLNLSVINYPDSLGLACNFMPYSIYLGGRRCYGGLPNNPNYNLGALTGSPCDTLSIGIGEVKKEDTWVRVYPNPNEGLFTLSFLSYKKYKDVFVYDVLGNIIYQQLKVYGNSINIDLRTQAKGVYFVKAIEDNFLSIAKVIIN